MVFVKRDAVIKLLLFIVFGSVLTISKPNCGDSFNCPEGCTIQYNGKCPESCKCPEAAICPDIPCPAEPPICVVYTKHNGCQSCACQRPFSVADPVINPIIKTSIRTTTTRVPDQSTRSSTEATVTTKSAIKTTTASTATTATTSATTTTSATPTITATITTTATTTQTATTTASAITTTNEARTSRFNQQQPFNPPFDAPKNFNSLDLQKEDNICGDQLQKEIEVEFGSLFSELKEKSRTATLMFPAIFEFSKNDLIDRCQTYKKSESRISYSAKKYCITNYEAYDLTYNAYSYACGYGTELYFSRYFECLASLKNDQKVISCDSPLSTDQSRQDVNSDSMCSTYDMLLSCIYESVVRKCGYDGWEIEYQFLSSVVRRFSRNCNLRRINITLNLRQSARVS